MLTASDIAEAARKLNEAERNRSQIGHLSLAFPSITIADAYSVQKAWVDIKLAEGRVMRGHKIGLTSRAMQVSSQIDEPDYGVLLDDMFFSAGCEIPFERFIEPRVEVELAFLLREAVRGPNCTLIDVLRATDYVVPAIEIIDARIERVDSRTKRQRRVFDTIADNAANAGLVMGGRPVKPADVDLRRVSALCYRNAEIEESGVAAAVLNHPGNGIAWLANKLAPHGAILEADEVVLAGSFTRPVAAAPGDVFYIDYGLLGSVTFRFSAGGDPTTPDKRQSGE